MKKVFEKKIATPEGVATIRRYTGGTDAWGDAYRQAFSISFPRLSWKGEEGLAEVFLCKKNHGFSTDPWFRGTDHGGLFFKGSVSEIAEALLKEAALERAAGGRYELRRQRLLCAHVGAKVTEELLCDIKGAAEETCSSPLDLKVGDPLSEDDVLSIDGLNSCLSGWGIKIPTR